jgi:hypothetical protein
MPPRARRRWLGRAAASIAIAAVTLLLSGCVRLLTVSGTQSPLDVVAVTVEVCATGSAPDCPRGAINLDASTGIGQVMLGFRIPEASDPPAGFESSDPAGVVSFSRSPTFDAELERLSPAGSGRRWAGYLSAPVNFTAGAGPQRFTATARFTLRQGADGAPFTTPFGYRVVAGSRVVGPSRPPNRDVACGASALDAGAADASSVCVNSPPLAALASDLTVATRDAGVLATGAVATAAPGALAALPFTVAYSGAGGDEAPRLSLSAATTLPGATVSAAPDALIPPANGSSSAIVTVQVPPGAAPGDYEVRLTATAPLVFRFLPIIVEAAQAPNPRSRVGVATIRVPAPAEVAAAGDVRITAARASVRFRRSRARGFVEIRGRSSAAGRLNVLVQRRGAVGSRGRTPSVRRSLFRSTRVRAGTFRARIPVAAGFVPGRYRVNVAPVTLDQVALPQRTTTVTLPRPREGVVDSAFVSLRRGGPSARRFRTRPRIIFANFRFAPGALPRRGRASRPAIQWFRNGRAIGRLAPRPRKRSLSAFVRLRNRARLPAGRYRAVLRSGRAVVAVATVRVG